MSRKINQEIFDSTVKDNIDEFSMSPVEAIADAVKQFECQNVDLSNIIKDLQITSSIDKDEIISSIQKLDNFSKDQTSNNNNNNEIIIELNILRTQCDKDIPHRVLASSNNAYNVLMALILSKENNKDVILECFKAMIALMTGQPDLLNDKGINLMMKYLELETNENIQSSLLKWIRECCLKHEMNRQNIFNADILNHLKLLLNHESAQILKDICGILQALVLDDDIRVEFGKAPEHARIIATHTLSSIIELLKKYKTDEDLINELVLTLSALIVRNEFCKYVDEAGGLDFALESLKNFIHNQKIIRNVFNLVKVLAGNDECKIRFIQKGGAPLITNAISEFETNAKTAHLGLNCIAALTLRSPENSKALFETGLAEIIVNVMNHHRDFMPVQKSASWAIRNMVVRCQNQIPTFLALDVEEILKENLTKFKTCEYDIKSALRDLNCQVDLKEEWTGKGGKITTQQMDDLFDSKE